jgi:hypothetical protein
MANIIDLEELRLRVRPDVVRVGLTMPGALPAMEGMTQMAHDELAIRLWADHLAFSMIHSGGVYQLYSRYTRLRTLVCETKSLRGVVRWLNKWMREELRRLE